MPQLSSILLVDDDPTTNYLNTKIVQRAEVAAHVLVAENGRQALDLLHQTCRPLSPQCPSLILLDVNMPVMTGIEFLEAYQQLPAPPYATVIVVLTTSLLPRDLERLRQLPIAGVLDKPLTTEKLRLVIAQHFPE
jgi:CheY-like chemotaxis protein